VITARLARIFAKAFALDPSEFNHGILHGDLKKWDSIGHMAMVAAMEKEFKVEFDVDEIMEMQSVAEIIVVLTRKGVTD